MIHMGHLVQLALPNFDMSDKKIMNKTNAHTPHSVGIIIQSLYGPGVKELS